MLRLFNVPTETFQADRLSNHKIKIIRDCLKEFESSEIEDDAAEYQKYMKLLDYVFKDQEKIII